jgi:uncharacterized repeat protein (TIGR02543 family)
VTVFLVRTSLQKVVPLFTDLNQYVEQMFSVTNGSDKTYPLIVNSGTSSGRYTEGNKVSIRANAPPSADYVFDQWTGDVDNVNNVSDASTTITMPGAAVTLTATYKEESISSVKSSQTDVPIIYPNPTDGFVNIETTQASQVQVFNVVGQKMYNNRETSTSHHIDVSNWKSEVYFVNIQCPGKVYCKKLIVNEIRE